MKKHSPAILQCHEDCLSTVCQRMEAIESTYESCVLATMDSLQLRGDFRDVSDGFVMQPLGMRHEVDEGYDI